ncbi:MAG: DUF4347 domain-containing protein, partial [Methylococcaceae bacterium]
MTSANLNVSAIFSSAPSEYVFIEDNLPHAEQLQAGVKPGAAVVMLDHTRDGLQQMAEALNGVTGLKAIHLVSHGAAGQLDLGTLKLTTDNLTEHATQLAALGGALAEGGDVLLYGCDVGQDLRFVEGLASQIGRDVAASDDLTGNVGKGGDWVLETQVGPIETPQVFTAQAEADYQETLAATVSTKVLTTGPGPAPLPFPVRTVNIGILSGAADSEQRVAIQNFKAYYDADPAYYKTSTIADLTQDLGSLDLAIIWFPRTNFSDAQIAAMHSFLDVGGRLYFNGEHNGYAPTQNAVISNAIQRLGGSISVVPRVLSDSLHDNGSDGIIELSDSPLMSGISSFKTAVFAPIAIDPDISIPVVTDDSHNIVIADQALSKGRVTAFADLNWVENYATYPGNMTFMHNLAVNSANNVDLVASGGNPNTSILGPSNTAPTIT